ncbi:MAG TPA: carboxypeptidase regulatory-like domain-containing protein [Candidatus Acidoferrum sp.]|nr:carboxypeptidase regulatory-like domain-containing protein [Candidatus Acidoferrum sp.]
MTRIRQQASTRHHQRWQFGIRSVQRASLAICAFCLSALFIPLATAQSSSSLNGSVSDQSGASVHDAKITLTDAAKGLQRSTIANKAGLYQFLDVPPGDYRLEATASGFATYLVEKVTLVVKTPSTIDIRLQLAGVKTSVNVEALAPLINRTDASLGNTLENDQISELPIADRNVVQLLSLQPGVSYMGIQSQSLQDTDTRSGAVNGLRSDQSNVTLDGIGVNDQNNGYAFTSVLNVPPDSVEEFRVTTANANADSGYSSGAQVALATKSGTNSFHGSAYEYNRNTIFSANDPFLKESQLSSGKSNTAPKLLRNVFGATFGGPIRKNRLFFFANYEGRRDAQGTSVLRDVPSPALRAGDLVYLCQTLKNGSLDTADCPGGTVNGVSGVQPGFYALGPAQIKAIDPLNIGPSLAIEGILNQYPAANENAGDAYVGSVGRRLPMQVDLAMPANLTDPSSKMTYFQAATMLSKAAANSTNVNQIQPIPFFENIFPAWASVTQSQLSSQSTALNCAPGNYPAKPTATQNIYELWNCFPHNETFSLFEMDLPASITGLSPALPNSKNGPYSFFHDQFASLYSWRNIGTSDYNALQVTYNVRWGANLQGQFNYTLSKSFDEASAAERVGPYEGTGGTGNDLNGGGIVINSWDPLSLRGLSDFNAYHQINANLVYRLPFGKGQTLGSGAGPLLNAAIGGWHVSGIFRWTSGFPITIETVLPGPPTGTSRAMPNRTGRLPWHPTPRMPSSMAWVSVRTSSKIRRRPRPLTGQSGQANQASATA